MSSAIKAVDSTRLVTLGDMAFSAEGAPLQCTLADGLDYYSLHPVPAKTAGMGLAALSAFYRGVIERLPDDGGEVIIEEMYPFPGAPGDGGWLGPGGVAGAGALLEMYINATRPRSVGWFAFYWGEAAALGMSGAAASEYTAWLKAWGAARPW
jgi:hypothetical protein